MRTFGLRAVARVSGLSHSEVASAHIIQAVLELGQTICHFLEGGMD